MENKDILSKYRIPNGHEEVNSVDIPPTFMMNEKTLSAIQAVERLIKYVDRYMPLSGPVDSSKIKGEHVCYF